MKELLLILITNLFVIASFAGDVLTLNNKMAFEGKVTKIKGCAVVFKADGNKYTVPASEVFSIQFENTEDKVYTKFMEMAQNNPSNCLQGRLDAQNYHGKRGSQFILGAIFGPLAVGATAASANPIPSKGRDTYAMSVNQEIFNDPMYLNCYRKKAKSKLLGMTALGSAYQIIVILLLFGPPAF